MTALASGEPFALGIRLAGAHTLVFGCGCVFARGDRLGLAAWRLCSTHLPIEYEIGCAFAQDGEPCLAVPRQPRVQPAASGARTSGGKVVHGRFELPLTVVALPPPHIDAR